MEKAVKVTIEKAPGQIIVINDKGVKWKYRYKSNDTSVTVVAATIATQMLNAKFNESVGHLLEIKDQISFILNQTKK